MSLGGLYISGLVLALLKGFGYLQAHGEKPQTTHVLHPPSGRNWCSPPSLQVNGSSEVWLLLIVVTSVLRCRRAVGVEADAA